MKTLAIILMSVHVFSTAQAAVLCTGYDQVNKVPVALYLEKGVGLGWKPLPGLIKNDVLKGTIFGHQKFFSYPTSNAAFTVNYAFENSNNWGCYVDVAFQSAVFPILEGSNPVSYVKFKLNYTFSQPNTRCAGDGKIKGAELEMVSHYQPNAPIKVQLSCQE